MFALIILLMGSCVNVFAEESTPVAPKPIFKPPGTYFVKKNKEFCEEIKTTEKNSVIYYNLDDVSMPATKGSIYTKSVPIAVNTKLIKAVNTKEGFFNSAEVVRYYHFSLGSPHLLIMASK